MTRKEFIKLLALMGLMPFANIAAQANQKPKFNKAKVLVVGAGMAGIAAAYFLKKEAYEVEIIESNQRLGGRIWTDRSSGTALDMGAGWIEGHLANPLYKLTESSGIVTKVSNYGNTYAYTEKGPLSDSEAQKLYKKAKKIFNETKRYYNNQEKEDRSVQYILDRVKKNYSLSTEEAKALDWHVSTIEVDYASEMKDFSFYLQPKSDGFFGDDLIIPDGYDQLPAQLAKGITIHYNERIVLVNESNSGVVLESSSGKKYEADYVIIAVPLGVLKSGQIQFSNPLPDWKQSAIDKMGMGKLYKIAIGYQEPFWPTDRDNLSFMSSTKGAFPIFLNWQHYTQKPFLVTAVGGSFMQSLQEQSEEEIGGALAKTFSQMFQKEIPTPNFIKVARWGENENAFGAYSYTPVGVDGNKNHDALAENVGRVYFAGEATNKKYPATVHGAFYSGEREANKLLKTNK